MDQLSPESRRLTVLICDDDELFRKGLRHLLHGRFDVKTAADSDEALAIVKQSRVDIAILDVQMRSKNEGLKAIPLLKAADEDLTIVMTSGLTDFATVREAMQFGAVDYIPKAAGSDDMLVSLERIIEMRRLRQIQRQQIEESKHVHDRYVLIGSSEAMASVRKVITKIKESAANVIITGETGTGKEVAARLLRGVRQDGSLAPFVAIDASTITGTLADSILFGHEKGAFTGADRTRKGIFEEADGGIVFFDEISNMSLEVQAKLLRVLQEREVRRIGSARTIGLQFRLVCATNRQLDKLIVQGAFKDDLYQRLNVIPLEIPPLRLRTEDIPELIEHFLQLQPGASRRVSFTKDAIEVMENYSWPGNVRELGNLVAYLTTMCDSSEIDVADLPPKLRDCQMSHETADVSRSVSGEKNFYKRTAEWESDLLRKEYELAGGNVSRMALNLGMDRSHLYTKLRLYKIHTPK